jgi:hypothetical protein
MAGLTISTADQATVLQQTAAKYGIPITALLGIYGQETSFGQNVHTSTTGAQGPFQFEPATARQYGYPLTNTPTLQQFMQQADAWGRYLVANNPSKSATGWAPAMRGGYTEATAEGTLAHIPSALKNAIGQAVLGASGSTPGVTPGPATPAAAVSGLTGAVSSIASAATSVGNFFTNTSMWLRVGEGLAAVLLLFLGLHALTGQSSSAGQQVKKVTRVMPVPV